MAARWNAGSTQEKGTAVSDNTPQNSPDVPPAPPVPPVPADQAYVAPEAPATPAYPTGYATPTQDSSYSSPDPSYQSAYAPPAQTSAYPGYPSAPDANAGYPQQPAPYGYAAPAYPYAAAPKTNALAITSLVAAIAGFVILPFIASIVAVITGHISLRQLRTSGEGGRGMALAGTIVGWVGVAGGILFIILMIVLWSVAFAGISYSTYDYS
jgi:hypothetical protein